MSPPLQLDRSKKKQKTEEKDGRQAGIEKTISANDVVSFIKLIQLA